VLGLSASWRVSVMLIALVVMTAGCRGSSSPRSHTSGPSGSTAGATPSKSAQMICSLAGQQRILADATGVRTTQAAVASWKNHLYSCRYTYGKNVMVLSVKEPANRTDTVKYFASLGHRLGISRTVPLGEDAFVTRDGSVVVRTDDRVLLVDMSKLPRQFGSPRDSRENIALNAASAIMSGWFGE
jgi:hypothetical protein